MLVQEHFAEREELGLDTGVDVQLEPEQQSIEDIDTDAVEDADRRWDDSQRALADQSRTW